MSLRSAATAWRIVRRGYRVNSRGLRLVQTPRPPTCGLKISPASRVVPAALLVASPRIARGLSRRSAATWLHIDGARPEQVAPGTL